MIKYTKEELYKMDAVDVYKMVLSGKIIKNFPSGYWTCKEARQNAAKCTRYVIEEILKYDDEMLKQKLSKKLFVLFVTDLYTAKSKFAILPVCTNIVNIIILIKNQ